ncbi:MAG: NfeD family protein [Clostridia bacterium]|nr:NfeD family protein [Clostridia bacterium]
MNFFTEIAILFSGMQAPVIVCLVVGLIFVIIEIFQPGFGIFGILGGLLLVVGIILRVLVGDGNVFAQIALLLFFLSIIIIGAFIIMVQLSKRGWISRSPLFQKATAVATDRSEGTDDFSLLIGKDGIATTDLRPVGKAEIEGRVYDVVSDTFYVAKSSKITVIAAEGVKITVKKSE